VFYFTNLEHVALRTQNNYCTVFNTKHLTAAALRDMGSGPGESAYDWVDIAG
jgi:hypothetical protein